MTKARKGILSWLIGQDFLLRAMAVLVGVFLMQYVSWMIQEEVVWKTETASLIKLTLLVVGFIYFIPKLPVIARSIIQLIVVFILTGWFLNYQFVPLLAWKWSQLLPFVDNNLRQLLPYLWFSLGTWVVFSCTVWFMSKRTLMYLGLIGSIIAFCIRDSFSNLALWKEIAVILFCSSMIVVINNMLQIRKASPDAWHKLSRKPFPILIPIVLFAFIFYSIVQYTPPIRPLLTDPYTAWKNYNGEQVMRFTTDEAGIISINQPEESVESGYSRDDSLLGGGFKYNYRTVMRVSTSDRSYWRGESRSVYTGSGWEKGPEELTQRTVVGLNKPLERDPKVDTSKAIMKNMEYTVTMEREEAYPVLFGAKEIKQLNNVNNSSSVTSKLSWSPPDAVINFRGSTNYPEVYTMISEVPVIDIEALRTIKLEDINVEEWSSYLQIPETMPARVSELAQVVTSNSATPYDKVKNIEQYLAGNFQYTNEPATGSSKDFVDQFLFETKEGYCDYFSTAMVMLTRSIGMPARWVKGFSAGSSLLEEMMERGGYRSAMQRSTEDDEYIVRNSDAHSWVEVYFPGWGWLPFEPTAGFAMPAIYDMEGYEPTNTPELAEIETIDESSEFNWNLRTWGFILAIAILAALVLFILYKYIPWRHIPILLQRTRYAGNYNQLVLNDVYRWLQYANRKGFMRLEQETTMRETLTRWMITSVWLERELETLLRIYERAHYSGIKLTQEEWSEANQTIRMLKIAMK